jgi:hypothetical protein
LAKLRFPGPAMLRITIDEGEEAVVLRLEGQLIRALGRRCGAVLAKSFRGGEMAQMIGASRETVTRLLSDLRTGGVGVLILLSAAQGPANRLRRPALPQKRNKAARQSGSPSLLGFLLLHLQKWNPNSAVSVRGVTKCVPLKVDRKL